MDLLTVKEVAELKGCTSQYIRKIVKEGKLEAVEDSNPANNRKQYLIPVSALPEKLQSKYYANIKSDAVPVVPELKETVKKKKKSVKKKSFDEYSAKEREEITLWCEILKEWQEVRNRYEKKTEADPLFVASMKLKYPDLNISEDILYRKYAAYKEGCLGDLLDGRGGWNKGQSTIPQEIWEGFLYYFLDDNRLPVSQCYKITQEWTKQFYPEYIAILPTERTFRRRIDSVPKAVQKLMRYGEKALIDECLPYIERLYDALEANDVWIADNHTFDIMTKYDGKDAVHRMSLTAFMDAKSGVLVGWNITDNPCSNSTIFALRHGILRFGAPKMVYFDNGSEFLTNDIAGRGHRTKKSQLNVEKPETILSRLGIEMKNALVRNARAKPIERMFLTFKNSISRLFESYTGGNIMEKPESLKSKIKNGLVPTDSEIRVQVADLIDGIYNMDAYGGAEKNKYKGYTRLEVWNESIQNRIQRKAFSEEELNLLLMRTQGYQKVKRKGVFIKIAGEKIWYSCENVWEYLDKEVYVRYDPTDISKVRIYDKEDRYMDTWNVERELMLNFIEEDQEAIKTASGKLARNKKAVKTYAKGLTANIPEEFKIDELDLRVRQARAAKEGMIITEGKTIMPIRANEEVVETLQKASGDDSVGVIIDINKLNKNSAARKK